MFSSSKDAKDAGWFSRRHKSPDAHYAATVGMSRRERLEEKREEAEARNARADATLDSCGHVHGRTGQRCAA